YGDRPASPALLRLNSCELTKTRAQTFSLHAHGQGKPPAEMVGENGVELHKDKSFDRCRIAGFPDGFLVAKIFNGLVENDAEVDGVHFRLLRIEFPHVQDVPKVKSQRTLEIIA